MFFSSELAAQSFALGLQSAPSAEYGAIPEAFSPLLGKALPSSVDLSGDMPPPGHQVDQSCVGWATAYALKTYQERIERQWDVTAPSGSIDPARVFSPSFIYNQINHGQDKGSNFGEAFHVLASQGAAPWSAMPYTGNPFDGVPPAAKAAAPAYRIDSFRTVNFHELNEVKAQLAAGFPVIIGAKVYQNFESLPSDAVWNSAQGSYLGNHAMAVVGYDDARQAFKVINSWGVDWSSNGFGWIGYNLFGLVVNEAYIVIDLKGIDSTPTTPTVPTDVWQPPVFAPESSTISVNPFCGSPFCVGNPSMSQHNFFDPVAGAVGMRLTGTLSIPAGVQGVAQVVIPLTFANGVPVAGLSPAFRLPSGQAAFGTPPVPLAGGGAVNLPWSAFIPYCALGVPKGAICLPYAPSPWATPLQSDLLATPILFIDNFGVAQGQQVPFFVRL